MAQIFRVIVPVTDIDRAATFYADVLDTGGQRVSPGRHYFDCEGVILACFDPVADGDDYDATPMAEPLYIAVDDISETHARASSAGAVFPDEDLPDVGVLGQIAKRPWGELSFYASDPFGNRLCFVSRDTVFTGSSP